MGRRLATVVLALTTVALCHGLAACQSPAAKAGGALAGKAAVPRGLARAGWIAESRRIVLAASTGFVVGRVTYLRNSLGMEFVRVPAGEFQMGDDLPPEEVHRRWPSGKAPWYRDAHPQHRVRITRPFLAAASEVTRAQFAQFVKDSGYRSDAERQGAAWALADDQWAWQAGASWRAAGFDAEDAHPAVCVTWNDANAFCAWLSKKEAVTYRLPTEAEWEYAARAGTDTTWYWGGVDTAVRRQANVAGAGEAVAWTARFDGADGFTWTAPVGRFLPNAFGLYDVIGNACEWCQDFYAPNSYTSEDRADPTGPTTGRKRVVRGGSWAYPPAMARAAFRDGCLPDRPEAVNGFRVVCELPSADEPGK